MRCACIAYASYAILEVMGVLVQIRDVPEEVHRTLKARAAASGVSLSEYLRSMLTNAASRPTPEEFRTRIRARGSVQLSEPSEVTVRRLRDSFE
jgi:antitoxin FitA